MNSKQSKFAREALDYEDPHFETQFADFIGWAEGLGLEVDTEPERKETLQRPCCDVKLGGNVLFTGRSHRGKAGKAEGFFKLELEDRPCKIFQGLYESSSPELYRDLRPDGKNVILRISDEARDLRTDLQGERIRAFRKAVVWYLLELRLQHREDEKHAFALSSFPGSPPATLSGLRQLLGWMRSRGLQQLQSSVLVSEGGIFDVGLDSLGPKLFSVIRADRSVCVRLTPELIGENWPSKWPPLLSEDAFQIFRRSVSALFHTPAEANLDGRQPANAPTITIRIGIDDLQLTGFLSALDTLLEQVSAESTPHPPATKAPLPQETEFRSDLSRLQAEESNSDETEMDSRQRALRSLVQRQGQGKFRKDLLSAYGERCAVTGFDAPSALEAAHIDGYLGVRSNSVSNGILLRADIHTLFDLGLIAFEVQAGGPPTVLLHPNLAGSSYEELRGRSLRIPDAASLQPDPERLNRQRERSGL